MASSLPSLMALLSLGPILLGLHLPVDAAGTPSAPAPTRQPLNLTAILDKGGQFTTFIRLLRDTQVGEQIDSQLNNSYGGLTVFAPTDNAFNNLKSGTLNGLSTQDQVSLVLFHVLPRFYTFDMFQTVSNPVRTQASGSDGPYTLNITSANNQANVSTGVDETRINTPLTSTFPLAVYPVDVVLLPYGLFGAKPPASAPPPAGTVPKTGSGSKAPSTPAAGGPASQAQTTPSAASFEGRSVGWGMVVGAGLVSMGLMW